jgi:hypothetical protein
LLFGFIGGYGNAVVEDNSGEQFGEAFDARMRRHDFSASWTSLNASPRKVLRETQFFVRVVRWRTVANVDSIGLVVRR